MAIAAKNRLTYRVQRQEKYWVRTPPRIRPTAPPPAATDPKTPNARPRSRGSRKVLTSVPRAAGAENGAEGALKSPGGHQHAERRSGAAERRGEREPGQTGDEDPLAAEHVAQPAADQQQAAERQRVGGYHPLPVAVREAQGVLSRRQGDVHHGGIQHHHELGDRHDDQDQPAMVAFRGTLTVGDGCDR